MDMAQVRNSGCNHYVHWYLTALQKNPLQHRNPQPDGRFWGKAFSLRGGHAPECVRFRHEDW
jgi:hypothetical protein